MIADKPFRLFTCCFSIAGVERALVCDVQRNTYQFIPSALYEILTEHDGKTLNEVKKAYNNEYDEIIEEYFEHLEKEEYIFFTNTPQYFPKMDLRWEEPFKITNAITDIDENTPDLPWENIIGEFEKLGCKHIQIRSFSDKPLSFFEDILKKCENKRVVSVELVIKYQSNFDKRLLFDFCQKYLRVFSIYAHSAPVDETLYVSEQGMGHIFFTKSEITSSTHCGIISPDYFTINIKTFTEAQKHNTCLNRKISIDTEGYIRNCPSMKEHYGNIKDTTLQEALQHPDFKKYWFINKDQVAVCKDCEFRYICTDCRAYIENLEDMYSKPLKCGYNPYTCEWEEWSTNPLKQKAIAHYGMKEMIMDKENGQ
jgi:SPASM domain peptide maturase of grasp-with-spasm system